MGVVYVADIRLFTHMHGLLNRIPMHASVILLSSSERSDETEARYTCTAPAIKSFSVIVNVVDGTGVRKAFRPGCMEVHIRLAGILRT